eukprot:5382768-Pleurochrysis_carterae.AAC.1
MRSEPCVRRSTAVRRSTSYRGTYTRKVRRNEAQAAVRAEEDAAAGAQEQGGVETEEDPEAKATARERGSPRMVRWKQRRGPLVGLRTRSLCQQRRKLARARGRLAGRLRAGGALALLE